MIDDADLSARLRREKFRADYFSTPPDQISQLAADAMIVVIDLEVELKRKADCLDTLMQERETAIEQLEAERRKPSDEYALACLMADRAELQKQLAEAESRLQRDVQRETIHADSKWMQHARDCQITIREGEWFADPPQPVPCTCGLRERLEGKCLSQREITHE